MTLPSYRGDIVNDIAFTAQAEGPAGLGELVAWMCSGERREHPEPAAVELAPSHATAGLGA